MQSGESILGPFTIYAERFAQVSALKVPPHVAEAVVNHIPGNKLIRVYDRSEYLAEKREALDLWAHHLKTEIAKATGANVTKLRG